jgi:two-component system response regulator AtoC
VEVNTVLIVDDEENIRHMLSLVLRKEGFECQTAANGQEALDMLVQSPCDIVLCDQNMPAMTGLQLLDEIRVRQIDVTFIMITAYGSVDNTIDAMKRGAYDYINKPFRPDEVLLTIRKAQERERLRKQNRALRQKLGEDISFQQIITQDDKMEDLFKKARKVAAFKSTVLITGESGTGKELLARAIHNSSDRAERPFVAVNCGAIPQNLIESELFGHEKGAFTDAVRQRRGLFEEAAGGTLLLDEVGELPQPMQVKLLRVLQEEELRRVGGDKTIKTDVRIIAATVRDLAELVRTGEFREDLFYRLNVMHLHVPPLRERVGDADLLVRHFIRRFNEKLGVEISGVSEQTLALLMAYHWPGNVRELENTIEHAMVLADKSQIDVDDIPGKITEFRPVYNLELPEDNLSIKKAVYKIENDLIRKALEKTGGNRTAAAKLLEISHRALLYKIKEYRITD